MRLRGSQVRILPGARERRLLGLPVREGVAKAEGGRVVDLRADLAERLVDRRRQTVDLIGLADVHG